MLKPKLNEALCQKLIDIVAIYIQHYPEEYKQYKKEQTQYQNNLRSKYAEISGVDGVVVRELLRLPETFHTILKLSLTTAELIEWSKEDSTHVPIYQRWFGNRFPVFRATKDRI